MALAIQEARKGAGRVAPNPMVGCVILDDDGRLLSKGYHKQYGGPHAEIEALKGLSEEQLEDAQIYVTLEPCAHQGKTPPCADHLAKLPIQSVTYGLIDPNPLVSGKGVQKLKAAGKIVKQATDLKDELEELAEIFLHNIHTQKPFVALKVASSLDGQMGLKSGESQWITNQKSRDHAHLLRASYDAILVGKRTIELDNPSLNIRHPDFPNHPNKIIVMDPDATLIPNFKATNVALSHRPDQIFFILKPDAFQKLSLPEQAEKNEIANLLPTPWTEAEGFDLESLLRALFQRGITSIMLEGGNFVYQTFLWAGQVQRLYQFQAPILIGAGGGLPWTQGFGIQKMADRIQLEKVDIRFFDKDILVSGRISPSQAVRVSS
ncbi:MAG: bifunctional diaminohydroxyphosphoribosylaminopyrimidine deaminase/5-amino-6-(5-phosphoribosylamino)uracil reductase RibD [Bdellovibrionales bacterium]|nr:bifunctional diaminohydroxyphosphoribosylaminopyrimidine deaminase/5-amino-6-(5-phosphoribosylamino)uracil reductase RibD [Bdellovibrionales bacterium]